MLEPCPPSVAGRRCPLSVKSSPGDGAGTRSRSRPAAARAGARRTPGSRGRGCSARNCGTRRDRAHRCRRRTRRARARPPDPTHPAARTARTSGRGRRGRARRRHPGASRQRSAMSSLLPCSPELNRGWCHIAATQVRGFAARSSRSQRSCAEPASQPPISAQLLFSDVDPPGAGVIGVPALVGIAGGCTEVPEIARRVMRLVLVVAGDRHRAVLDRRPAPRRSVALLVLGERAALVGVVAEREHGPVDACRRGRRSSASPPSEHSAMSPAPTRIGDGARRRG